MAWPGKPVLLVLGLVFLVAEPSRGKISNKLAPPGSAAGITAQYFSKSYGKSNWNKLNDIREPKKGSAVWCTMQCLTAVDNCHCVEINKKTSECRFYDDRQGPFLVPPTLDINGNRSSSSDFIYYTKDSFDEANVRVDIIATKLNRIQTSQDLSPPPDTGDGDGKKKTGKSKPKNSIVISKNAGTAFESNRFPKPWVQFEFKDSVYVTGISLKPTANKDVLKGFQIRVGDNSILKHYQSSPWNNVTMFEANNICFAYEGGDFFATKWMRKSIHCKPCGVRGKFLTIQTNGTCTGCRPPSMGTSSNHELAGKLISMAIGNVKIYGYSV